MYSPLHSHLNIAIQLMHSQPTEAGFPAKAHSQLPVPSATLASSSCSGAGHIGTARKPLQPFTWKHRGYPDTELPFHSLEQHNPSARTRPAGLRAGMLE